jgi:hypothetical protein
LHKIEFLGGCIALSHIKINILTIDKSGEAI